MHDKCLEEIAVRMSFVIINEFHRDTSLKQNFRAKKTWVRERDAREEVGLMMEKLYSAMKRM